MLYNSLLDLLSKGGYTVLVLVLCSVLSLKVIIEKAVLFKGLSDKVIDDFKAKINTSLQAGDKKEALFYCKTYSFNWMFFNIKTPLAQVFKYILEHTGMSEDLLLERSFAKLDKEIIKMEKGLGILATLGSISPFIGLFGTVIGIIRSFEALALNEASGYLNVMSGIAEALVSTAAGLLVAVPAVMFYNYFMRKIKSSMPTFEEAIHDLVYALRKNDREVKNASLQDR
ncbi:MAG: MotA/TolQ/ExbB proton channel family protein [Syntrophomonadaceae bacterium]